MGRSYLFWPRRTISPRSPLGRYGADTRGPSVSLFPARFKLTDGPQPSARLTPARVPLSASRLTCGALASGTLSVRRQLANHLRPPPRLPPRIGPPQRRGWDYSDRRGWAPPIRHRLGVFTAAPWLGLLGSP
jgi:hypothetical protein